MARELENFLSHTTHTSRFGVEGESIQSIDIVLYSKMEHTSTSGRGGASTYVISTGVRSGVISTGFIKIHHICVGGGNCSDSGNAKNAEDSIVLSSSLSYWGMTTNRMKEEILQQHMVCVIKKSGPKGSRELDTHHDNAIKAV